MKKILILMLGVFSVVAINAQTEGIPSNITANQAFRTAASKQTGGTLPVLKLVPVTTSGKFVYSQGQYLTNEGLFNGFMRKMTDGTYALAVDATLIGGGGGAATPSNLALGTGTATSQPITNSNGTGVTLTGATTGTAGLLVGTDKAKLDLITVTSAVNLNNLLLGNTAITGATKTKITYDSKGLVTAGADATTSDILTSSAITIGATTYPIGTTTSTILSALNSNVGTTGTVLTTAPITIGATTFATGSTTQSVLAAIATDATVMHLTGAETVTGVKTFTAQPVGITGASIVNVAAGNIAATTTQAAVNELDAEKQVNIQFQNAATNLGTAGTATTLNFTGGATATRLGDVVTVNVATTPLAIYSDDTEAAAGGVSIGSSYYLDSDNPHGLPIGSVKVRIN